MERRRKRIEKQKTEISTKETKESDLSKNSTGDDNVEKKRVEKKKKKKVAKKKDNDDVATKLSTSSSDKSVPYFKTLVASTGSPGEDEKC